MLFGSLNAELLAMQGPVLYSHEPLLFCFPKSHLSAISDTSTVTIGQDMQEPSFVGDMEKYLLSGINATALINEAVNSAGGDPFFLQLFLYILVRVAPTADTYTNVASNLTTTAHTMTLADTNSNLMKKLDRFYADFMSLLDVSEADHLQQCHCLCVKMTDRGGPSFFMFSALLLCCQ